MSKPNISDGELIKGCDYVPEDVQRIAFEYQIYNVRDLYVNLSIDQKKGTLGDVAKSFGVDVNILENIIAEVEKRYEIDKTTVPPHGYGVPKSRKK